MKTKYITVGLSLTEGQKVTLAKAARNGSEATIRLTHGQLRGDDKLGLTTGQANRVAKSLAKGRGMELRFTKTQMKNLTKNGGFLPLLALLPLIAKRIAVAGAAAGGAAGIAQAVNAKKAAMAAQAEAERHNRELEAQLKNPGGSGLFLGRQTTGGCCPMCKGSGLFSGKKLKPLSNFDIEKAARGLPNFRGVFMRDNLPVDVNDKECGIVNLDSNDGVGTHWIAYRKDGPTAVYFDSYGLDPPHELAKYLNCPIKTQTFQLQGPNDVICGHLCLLVLKELAAGKKYEEIILKLC